MRVDLNFGGKIVAFNFKTVTLLFSQITIVLQIKNISLRSANAWHSYCGGTATIFLKL